MAKFLERIISVFVYFAIYLIVGAILGVLCGMFSVPIPDVKWYVITFFVVSEISEAADKISNAIRERD